VQRLSPSAPGFEPLDGVIPFAAVPPLPEEPNPAFAVEAVTPPARGYFIYGDIAVCPSGTGELVVLDGGDLHLGGDKPAHLQILSAESQDPADRSYPLPLSGAVFPASLSVVNGRPRRLPS